MLSPFGMDAALLDAFDGLYQVRVRLQDSLSDGSELAVRSDAVPLQPCDSLLGREDLQFSKLSVFFSSLGMTHSDLLE
jgi:hypothetical protein